MKKQSPLIFFLIIVGALAVFYSSTTRKKIDNDPAKLLVDLKEPILEFENLEMLNFNEDSKKIRLKSEAGSSRNRSMNEVDFYRPTVEVFSNNQVDFQITSEKGTLFKKGNNTEVQFNGNLLIKKMNDPENTTVKADKAVFKPKSNTVLLKGNVLYQSDGISVRADFFEYNISP